MVYSYLVIYVMVESVVYEEIYFQGKRASPEEMTSDTDSENKEDACNTEIIHASSVYVKMNEMNLDHIEEIDTCQTYQSHLKHRLSSSGSSENSYVSKMAYPPPYTDFVCADVPDEFEITAKMSYTPPYQRRSQIISIENTEDSEIPVFHPPSSRRSQLSIAQSQGKESPSHETIYTKIVAATTNPAESPVKYSNGARETRESENPILRQESVPERIDRVCPLKRATSLDDIHVTTKTRNHYEFINIKDKKYGRARSCEERKRIRSLHYENSNHEMKTKTTCTKSSRCCSRKRRSCCEHPDSCNNVKGRRYENEIVEICNGRNGIRYENEFFTSPNGSNNISSSHYENICEENHAEDEQYYESVSDQESGASARERSMSRPIDIKLYSKQNINYELHYSDIDFGKSSKPFSCSSSSLSNRGSISSSMSSDISSFASNSISPPPLPNPRPRLNRFSSNLSCLAGLNSFPASYLGETTLSRITPDTVDAAVRNIAHDTNFLEMKPVLVDISQENIRFESTSSTWDILVNVSTHDIVRYEVMLKNALYVAIIAGKPGEEASCYVLQSDKANEIHDSIRGVLHNYTQIPPSRSRSTYELSPTIEPESHRFHYIVKIGSIKVKKSFSLVSNCMKMLLERVNPKEFKSCNMDVYRHSVVVTCTDTRELETHSTPSILSIDLDEKDRRYFGFIISEKAPNNKTKIVCYVYRAAREKTAEKIIEAIQSSCKQAGSSQYFPNTSINPIYVGCRSASVGRLSSVNRTARLGTMPSCSSVSSLSHFSLSSSTPCPSDSSPSSGNSRKSSVADVGWKFDNTSLTSIDPSDSNLLRTCSMKSHTLLQTVQQIVETRNAQHALANEENGTEERISKPLGYKLSRRSKLFGKIKQTLLTKTTPNSTSESRRSSHTPVASPTTSPIPPVSEIQLETSSYNVKYICSTVITPPLKEKRVKEIYRQFNKEVDRNGKPHTSNSIGKSIDLQIVTSEGVFLLDRTKPNTIERQFTVLSIDKFMKHPDGTGFFAFSVKIPDNTKHKCHLFCVNKAFLPSIDAAFEKLMAMKQLLNLASVI